MTDDDTDRGLVGWVEREAAEQARIPRSGAFDPTAYLRKLARDFGPATAQLAAEYLERELKARDRSVPRAARKLDAAGRKGFR